MTSDQLMFVSSIFLNDSETFTKCVATRRCLPLYSWALAECSRLDRTRMLLQLINAGAETRGTSSHQTWA